MLVRRCAAKYAPMCRRSGDRGPGCIRSKMRAAAIRIRDAGCDRDPIGLVPFLQRHGNLRGGFSKDGIKYVRGDSAHSTSHFPRRICVIWRCCSAASRNSVSRSLRQAAIENCQHLLGALACRANNVRKAEALFIQLLALGQFGKNALRRAGSRRLLLPRPGKRLHRSVRRLAVADARMAGESLHPVRLLHCAPDLVGGCAQFDHAGDGAAARPWPRPSGAHRSTRSSHRARSALRPGSRLQALRSCGRTSDAELEQKFLKQICGHTPAILRGGADVVDGLCLGEQGTARRLDGCGDDRAAPSSAASVAKRRAGNGARLAAARRISRITSSSISASRRARPWRWPWRDGCPPCADTGGDGRSARGRWTA